MAERENGDYIVVTRASRIKPRRQKWFWEHEGRGIVPLATTTIFAGKGGEGKTTFALSLAAQLTCGMLTGDLHGQTGEVVIIGPEDDWGSVMIPRLIAAGADLDKVLKLTVETVTDEHTGERTMSFPIDVAMLREVLEECDVKLIIIDPAPSLMAGDTNKVQDVRRAYEPLIALAQEFELALILINHFGKGAGDVSAKLSGSHAWRDLTRSYLAFVTDPTTDERIMTQDKNNYGTSKGSYKFNLVSQVVDLGDGESADVARVDFLGESDRTAQDVLDEPSGQSSNLNEYQAFLVEYLTGNGERPAQEVMVAAREAGLDAEKLKKQRFRMKNPAINARRQGFGNGGAWFWSIANEPTGSLVVTVDFSKFPDGPSPRRTA